MAAKKLNLTVRQGETFLRVIRWETLPFVYKTITAITKSGPVSITATGHGLVTGWRTAVVSVVGMEEINAKYNPPHDHEFKQCTYVDANTITLNTVNTAEYDAYVSGGYLQYYTPVDLTSYTARLQVKDKVGGTVLESLVSPTDIALDNANHTITVTISATDTAAYTFQRGVYDFEMVSPSGVVTTIFAGNFVVTKEVTT